MQNERQYISPSMIGIETAAEFFAITGDKYPDPLMVFVDDDREQNYLTDVTEYSVKFCGVIIKISAPFAALGLSLEEFRREYITPAILRR